MRCMFEKFDRNRDGQISVKELRDSLVNFGIEIPEKELEEMIERIDINGNDCVGMAEFGELYKTIMEEHDDEEDMREAFNVFDQNRDGFITVDELCIVSTSLGLQQGRSLEECQKMIVKVYVDRDGMVNYKEFRQMMKGGEGFIALG